MSSLGCPNGNLNQPYEQWDDNNSINGDGWDCKYLIFVGKKWKIRLVKCYWQFIILKKLKVRINNLNSANWKVENGWNWNTGSPSSWSTVCGDGIKLNSEDWDDGNQSNNDGWNSSWRIETGWSWTTQNGNSQWTSIWGDGIKTNEEKWDDGNITFLNKRLINTYKLK